MSLSDSDPSVDKSEDAESQDVVGEGSLDGGLAVETVPGLGVFSVDSESLVCDPFVHVASGIFSGFEEIFVLGKMVPDFNDRGQ